MRKGKDRGPYPRLQGRAGNQGSRRNLQPNGVCRQVVVSIMQHGCACMYSKTCSIECACMSCTGIPKSRSVSHCRSCSCPMMKSHICGYCHIIFVPSLEKGLHICWNCPPQAENSHPPSRRDSSRIEVSSSGAFLHGGAALS